MKKAIWTKLLALVASFAKHQPASTTSAPDEEWRKGPVTIKRSRSAGPITKAKKASTRSARKNGKKSTVKKRSCSKKSKRK